MLRTPLDCPWANETDRASHRAAPPIQRDSAACDVGSWWERLAANPAVPKRDRASGVERNHFRQQRPTEPTLPALGFGGVFFEPSAKLAHTRASGLNIPVDRLPQNEAEALEPVPCLPWFQVNVADLLQKLDHDNPIPASAPQSEIFRRFRQRLLQLALRYRIHACGSARTRFVEHAVDPLAVGFANPVHDRLSAHAEQATHGRRFPTSQKQQQASDANSVPGTGDCLRLAQQGFPRSDGCVNFERFHAYSLTQTVYMSSYLVPVLQVPTSAVPGQCNNIDMMLSRSSS